MSYLIKCQSCGQTLRMSDSLFAGRIQGNLVAVRCKHCKAPMAVDGQATTELTSPLMLAPEEAEYEPPDNSWRDQALSDAVTAKQVFEPASEHEGAIPSAKPVTTNAEVSAPASKQTHGVRYAAVGAGLCALGIYASTQMHTESNPARVIEPIVETSTPSNAQQSPAQAPEVSSSSAPLTPPESPESPAGFSVTPGEVAVPEIGNAHVPKSVAESVLEERLARTLRRATRCPTNRRDLGEAQLFMTFGSNGHVQDAYLEGEPLASAPVSRCILEHAKATRIPSFQGAAFTVARRISLR